MSCAVSGGADSLALLALAIAADLQVTAIHVDHGIRSGSATEASIVEHAASAVGASFKALTVQVSPGPNLEARARDARYRVLPNDVLTGHTADDQAETVLLNILRGAGIDGLAGMRPSGGPSGQVRHPILGIRRFETEAVCALLGWEPVRDPSNEDQSLLRNRVRHQILPLLNEASSRDLVPIFSRQASLMADDSDVLDALAKEINPTDAKALASAPVALARRAIRLWLSTTHPPDAASVERVLAVARGEVTACELPGGLRISRTNQRIFITPPLLRASLTVVPPKLRGKWALGITPRNFTWIVKDRLAVCERPGGYGDNHRRVRRQEEIIWIRENHFGCLISIIAAPHNLHNYDELSVNYQHRPFNNENNEKIDEWARGLFKELKKLLTNNVKVIVHGEEVGDIIMGAMAAFVRWQGMVEDPIEAIAIGEKLAGHQLDPSARELIMRAHLLR